MWLLMVRFPSPHPGHLCACEVPSPVLTIARSKLTEREITGMAVFCPKRVSRAMVRASGMYSELRSEQSIPTSETEYFMAAMHYVGNITDCDVPELKEAALIADATSSPALTNSLAAKLNCPESIAREGWIRFEVHRDFEVIMTHGRLQRKMASKLKEFLFWTLLPLS